MLTLTSCTRVREPEFSPSECLELAREIERRTLAICKTGICVSIWCHGERVLEPVSERQRDAIVAALRAYAND